jgi:hypothetical protein
MHEIIPGPTSTVGGRNFHNDEEPMGTGNENINVKT